MEMCSQPLTVRRHPSGSSGLVAAIGADTCRVAGSSATTFISPKHTTTPITLPRNQRRIQAVSSGWM